MKAVPGKIGNIGRNRGVLLVALTLVLGGCKKEETGGFHLLEESSIRPAAPDAYVLPPRIDANGNKTSIQLPGDLDRVSLGDVKPNPPNIGDASALSETHEAAQRAIVDYTDKADIYWKLNWIRRELVAGRIPRVLEEAIPKLREQLRNTREDGNRDLAEEAVDHLEKGLKHYMAKQALQQGGVSNVLVPFSMGRDGVERFIADNGLGFGGKSMKMSQRGEDDDLTRPTADTDSDASLTAAQQKAITLLLDYAETYHASPEQMMQKEWKLAIEKTNELRNNLALKNRKENRDADDTLLAPVTDESVGSQMDKTFPTPGMGDVTASPNKKATSDSAADPTTAP